MKTKIIIDCSVIFHQIIHRTCGYKGKNIPDVVNSGRKYLTEEDEQNKFIQSVHAELSMLDNFTSILGTDGIYFAFDSLNSKSFRYNMLEDYKQGKNRTKEQVYCSDSFKICVQKYHNILLENGYKVIEIDSIEADDIFLSFKNLIPKIDNICIVTSDSDIDQLLDHRTFIYNPIDQYTKITSDLRKSATPVNDSVFDEFFDSSNDAIIDSAYERFFSNHKVVDPDMELAKKIILGDPMDNISPSFKYRTKNGKSEFNFTKDRMKKLLEAQPDVITMNNIVNDDNFLDLLNTMSVAVGRDLDHTRIEEYRGLRDFNRKMIDLSESQKVHKSSPEIDGIIMDQLKKPNKSLGVISFYTNEERYT